MSYLSLLYYDDGRFNPTAKTHNALHHLAATGALAIEPDGQVTALPAAPADETTLNAALTHQERQAQFSESRLTMVRTYAELYRCRRPFLLHYFGDGYTGPCGNCDNCDEASANPAEATAIDPCADVLFALNSRVHHQSWGTGLVTSCNAETVTVLFDEVGYKTLSLE